MTTATLKRCSRCKQEKPTTEFHRDKSQASGLSYACKTCRREQHRENRETYRAANRRYEATHADTRRVQKIDYRANNPDKARARDAVHRAVRAGRLTRPNTCERCDASGPVHGHHGDYSKPLAVQWLCSICHALAHLEEESPDAR